MCVLAQPPKLAYFFDEIKDGLTNGRFGVVATVRLCGNVSTAFMSFSQKVTASS